MMINRFLLKIKLYIISQLHKKFVWPQAAHICQNNGCSVCVAGDAPWLYLTYCWFRFSKNYIGLYVLWFDTIIKDDTLKLFILTKKSHGPC